MSNIFDGLIFDSLIFDADETIVTIPPIPPGPTSGPWTKLTTSTGAWVTAGIGGGIWTKTEPPGGNWA